MDTEDFGTIRNSITTPAVVEARSRRFEFVDGYPSAETATRLRDELNHVHAVQAFMSSIQGVSLWALRKGFAEVGIEDNDFIIFSELMDAESLFLTANADTVYFWGNVDLVDGPMVLEVPPNVLGVIDDFTRTRRAGSAAASAGTSRATDRWDRTPRRRRPGSSKEPDCA